MPTERGIPHAIACRALEVSQSWFYKWINRKPTARQQRRERVHRSQDRGRLPRARHRPVDGPVGCALDNAAAEAFNSTLKVEFVHRQHFTTRAEARIKISTWIADFYNTDRRHTANDGLAPITFELRMAEKRRASTAQLRAEVA